MDKTQLKKFAQNFRQILLEEFKAQLKVLDDHYRNEASSIHSDQYQLFQALQNDLRAMTPGRFLETAVYTWFNRFVALRFLELNQMLPPEHASPWESKESLLRSTKDLGQLFPQIFTTKAHFDLLLPDDEELLHLLKPLFDLKTSNFESIEVIGWLYQYYQQETPGSTSKRKPYTKDEIPARTQLFTPNWVVRFLVENSLGDWWVKHGGTPSLLQKWPFYVKRDTHHSGPNATSLEPNRGPLPDPTSIKIFDPCCGSGHILVYAFTVLEQIYQACGFSDIDIPELILRHNLSGIDIDQRAAELATFAVFLRARTSDSQILQRPIARTWRCYSFPEPAIFPRSLLDQLPSAELKDQAHDIFDYFTLSKEVGSLLLFPKERFGTLSDFLTRNEYASRQFDALKPYIDIYQVITNQYDFVITNPPYLRSALMNQPLKEYLTANFTDYKSDLFAAFFQRCLFWLKSQGYFAVMTPSVWLRASTFVKLRQMILRDLSLNVLVEPAPGSFFSDAAVNICASVFQIATSQKHTTKPEASVFGRITEKTSMPEQGQLLQQAIRSSSGTESVSFHQHQLLEFQPLPGHAFLYHLSPRALQLLRTVPNLATYAPPRQGMITGNNQRFIRYWFEVPPEKLDIRWLPHNKGGGYRKWYGNREYVIDWEDDAYAIKNNQTQGKRRSRVPNFNYNFQPSLSWSALTSGNLSVRYYDKTFTFNSAGISCFPPDKDRLYLLGLLNSKVAQYFAKALSSSLNFNAGDLAKIPIIFDETIRHQVETLTQENLDITQSDYDEHEISRNFTVHPLISIAKEHPHSTFASLCEQYQAICQSRQQQLCQNETTLNQLFITSFRLTNEISPIVPLNSLSIHVPNTSEIIQSFLSFFVGCIFGRFEVTNFQHIPPTFLLFSPSASANLQTNALMLNSQPIETNTPIIKSQPIETNTPIINSQPIETNTPIIKSQPIETGAPIASDVIAELKAFLKSVFPQIDPATTLEFLADHLDRNFHESAESALRRYFIKKFFIYHARTYCYCPIYWQLDSSKKHAFTALFYIHAYHPSATDSPLRERSTLLKLNAQVLAPIISRYQNVIDNFSQKIHTETSLTTQRALRHQLDRLRAELEEIQTYQQKVCNLLDRLPVVNLDYGIQANYAKLQTVLSNLPSHRSSH